MADGPFDPETGELISRAPEQSDLVSLCRELQKRNARFVVVGGFAIIMSGLGRSTGDVDLLIATDAENEARVFDALATLPDGCVRELDPGDVARFKVVRVSDEILVDLMPVPPVSTTQRRSKALSSTRLMASLFLLLVRNSSGA